MLAFLALIFLSAPADPKVLTVPIPDTKSIWISHLADCESHASTTVKVLDTNGKYSYGLLQFQMQTWLAYGKSFGATRENIFDAVL